MVKITYSRKARTAAIFTAVIFTLATIFTPCARVTDFASAEETDASQEVTETELQPEAQQTDDNQEQPKAQQTDDNQQQEAQPEETADEQVSAAGLQSSGEKTGTNITINCSIEDPEFNKYYTLDGNGNILEKAVISRVGSSGVEYKHPTKYAGYNVYKCIDVSEHQGNINWEKVKAAGITHAIIRVAYRGQTTGGLYRDSRYAENIKGAYNAGIKVGVYIYSQAISKTEAQEEAKYITNLIKGYNSMITMPVVFDYEFGLSKSEGGRFYAGRLTKSQMTDIAIAFCEYVKNSGYEPMVYANYNMLCNYLDRDKLSSNYKIWLAHYNTSTDYPGEFYMWQYTSSGKVSGITPVVDMNFIYEKETDNKSYWVKNSSGQYMFMKQNGVYAKSEWINDGGHRYYINSSGVRSTGYKKIGNYYYLFSSSGVMRTGTVKVNDKKYILGSKGISTIYTAKLKTSTNFRTGPSTAYKKKGTYKKGKTVSIIYQKNGWGKMTNGYWLKLKYTKKVKSYPAFVPYKVKTTTALKCRKGPSTKYKVKKTYKKGTKVTIKSVKNGWGKTDSGYIDLRYTKRI